MRGGGAGARGGGGRSRRNGNFLEFDREILDLTGGERQVDGLGNVTLGCSQKFVLSRSHSDVALLSWLVDFLRKFG